MCSIKINRSDIIQNCPDYENFKNIYITYSCYGKELKIKNEF